jgi:hypothetical protein
MSHAQQIIRPISRKDCPSEYNKKKILELEMGSIVRKLKIVSENKMPNSKEKYTQLKGNLGGGVPSIILMSIYFLFK